MNFHHTDHNFLVVEKCGGSHWRACPPRWLLELGIVLQSDSRITTRLPAGVHALNSKGEECLAFGEDAVEISPLGAAYLVAARNALGPSAIPLKTGSNAASKDVASKEVIGTICRFAGDWLWPAVIVHCLYHCEDLKAELARAATKSPIDFDLEEWSPTEAEVFGVDWTKLTTWSEALCNGYAPQEAIRRLVWRVVLDGVSALKTVQDNMPFGMSFKPHGFRTLLESCRSLVCCKVPEGMVPRGYTPDLAQMMERFLAPRMPEGAVLTTGWTQEGYGFEVSLPSKRGESS